MLEGSGLCRGMGGIASIQSVIAFVINRRQIVHFFDIHLLKVLLQLGVVEHADIVGSMRIVRKRDSSVSGQDVL